MNDEIKARENQLITDMMELLRQEITDILGDELDCTIDLPENPFGFYSAWLEGEDHEQVWWDKSDKIKLDELTELCALHLTIKMSQGIEPKESPQQVVSNLKRN